MQDINTITIVLEGQLKPGDLDAMANRIRKAIRGEAISASKAPEFKECDGISIKDWVCIGHSK